MRKRGYMYRVLIIDDEEPARELLKMRVEWERINCVVVGSAKNGKEGLDLYHTLKPDLIITDIEMPVMDGLKLIESIKLVDESQPIIILSCHESFAFARKAMQLGVYDYLIKDSFDTLELYSIISTLFKERETEKKENSASKLSQNDIRKSEILKSIILDGVHRDKINEYAKDYNLNLVGKTFELLAIDIERLNQNRNNPEEQYLDNFQIVNITSSIRQILSELAEGEVCYDRGNYFIVVYSVTNTYSQLDIQKEAINISSQIRYEINKLYNVQSTIGVSLPFNDLILCSKSYASAVDSTKRKIISGYNKNYCVANQVLNNEDQYIKILNVKLKRVNEYLLTQQFEPMKKELKDIYLQNLKGFMQYNYLKHSNWMLLGMFIEYCSKSNLSFMDICKSRFPWEVIMEIKTVEEMCNWFLSVVNEIQGQIALKDNDTYSYYVDKCVKYIKQHFSENISFSELSEFLEINNAYLSRIFKKETGKSLTDYLTDVRIEESKNMVLNTNKKMYEIAEIAGFSSTQRFFLAFKKAVGVSPGDFKNAVRRQVK